MRVSDHDSRTNAKGDAAAAEERGAATRLINVGQAAELLGVSPASLRKWSDEGLLAVHRTPGGQRRYSQADLDEFIRSMRQPPRSAATPAANGAGAKSS
jgi:excisionase family DNA binding protein